MFPYFIVNVLPTGLTGLLVASIFAAGMSTVSTSITSGATVVLCDFYQKIKMKSDAGRPSSPTRRSGEVSFLRLSSIIIGLLGMTVALALVDVDSILDSWWKLSSIFSGGMLGLFLLGFISQEVRNVDAAIGVVCGFLVIAWISLGNSGIHEYLAIVFGTITIFLVGFLLAKQFHGKRK